MGRKGVGSYVSSGRSGNGCSQESPRSVRLVSQGSSATECPRPDGPQGNAGRRFDLQARSELASSRSSRSGQNAGLKGLFVGRSRKGALGRNYLQTAGGCDRGI